MKMQLYICTHCDVLLMRVDSSVVADVPHFLEESGMYEEGNYGEAEHQYWLCPICSGIDSHEYSGMDITLESYVFNGTEISKKLIDLWNKLKQIGSKDPEREEIIRFGIPLDTKELKSIVMEDGIFD